MARLESGHTPSRQAPEYWAPEECTIPWFSLADVWQLREARQTYLGETAEKISPLGVQNSAARVLPAGTVVLSRTASVGFAGIMPRPMATTQDFANWVPGPRLVPEYLLQVFRAMAPEFERLRMGSTHQTIYMPDIQAFRVPLPPVEIQREIASFVDHRTASVDDLIEKRERLIVLLQEKRQVLINQAVTKGLEQNVPLKDSGVASLGLVPAHWKVVKLGHLLFDGPRNGVSPQVNEAGLGVKSFSISAVRHGRVVVREQDIKWVTAAHEDQRRFDVRANDLLLVRGNGNIELVGTCGLVSESLHGFVYPDLLMRLRARRCVSPRYLRYAINSSAARRQLESAARTTVGTYKVNNEQVRRVVLAMPPPTEADQLAAVLEEEESRLDSLVALNMRQVALLREYRQALITAAVTGKLDLSKEAC